MAKTEHNKHTEVTAAAFRRMAKEHRACAKGHRRVAREQRAIASPVWQYVLSIAQAEVHEDSARILDAEAKGLRAQR